MPAKLLPGTAFCGATINIMALENSISEEKIVSLLKEKDARGMYYLYEKYGEALYGLVYSHIPIIEVAEEVLQQVMISIWQKINSFDSNKQRLYTWLLQITRKLAVEKAATIDLTGKVPYYAINVKRDTATENEDINPDNIGINEVMTSLRREQKQLLDLVFFTGLTPTEAAARLRMPLGTVKTRVRSVILELRKLFQLA